MNNEHGSGAAGQRRAARGDPAARAQPPPSPTPPRRPGGVQCQQDFLAKPIEIPLTTWSYSGKRSAKT